MPVVSNKPRTAEIMPIWLLKEDLSLDALSRVGCFSKFHFHRVFKSITEETVNDMVVRMRLERAANLLRTSR